MSHFRVRAYLLRTARAVTQDARHFDLGCSIPRGYHPKRNRAMKRSTIICLCAAMAAASWGRSAPSQQAQQPQAAAAPDSIKARTNEVLLDVVVRDKKGR